MKHTTLAVPLHPNPISTKKKFSNLPKKISADAIHPGYGFFSENASFIKDVEDMGITFIGPSSKSVSMMGSKTCCPPVNEKQWCAYSAGYN